MCSSDLLLKIHTLPQLFKTQPTSKNYENKIQSPPNHLHNLPNLINPPSLHSNRKNLRRRNFNLLNNSKLRIQRNPRNKKQHPRNHSLHSPNYYHNLTHTTPTKTQKTIPKSRRNNMRPRSPLLHLPPTLHHQSNLPILHDSRRRKHLSSSNNNSNKKPMKLNQNGILENKFFYLREISFF